MVRATKFYAVLVVLGLFLSSTPSVQARDSNIQVTNLSHVPSGFEEFLEPQETVVDVYYGGKFVTTISAVVTLDTIEFAEPGRLVKLIPGVANTVPVIQALYGELDANVRAICSGDEQEQCGVLEPAIAGVIFDEARFRADLFIHPDYLELKSLEFEHYLPDSTAGLAMMQNLTGNVSGSLGGGDQKENYTLFGRTLFSAKENSIQAGWDISRDTDVSINQLLFERDYQGLLTQAGLVYGSGFGLNFSSSSRLWGGRIASSYNTRIDQSFVQGTPLEIFMPVKGRYEVIYEKRLISSGFIEAGSQALDTSGFPGGAYEVTIRLINESGKLVREEKRFFARQSRLPPSEDPEFFLEAGRRAETSNEGVLPKMTDSYVGRAGVNLRLNDVTAGTLAIAATQGQILSEASMFNVGRNYDFSSGVMISADGDKGLRADANYRAGDLSLGGSYLQLWRNNNNLKTDEYDLLGNSFRQNSFSGNYPLFSGSVNYRYSDSRNEGEGGNVTRQIRQNISYGFSLFRSRSYSASVSFDVSWTSSDEITALASISLSGSKDNWSFHGSPKTRYQRSEGTKGQYESSLQVGANYYDSESLNGKLNASLSAEKSANRLSTGFRGSYSSLWGSGNAGVNYAKAGSEATTTYSGSISSSFMTNGETIAFGGESQGQSAVMVTIEGANPDDSFDIYVDDQKMGYAQGDNPGVIALSPFNTYRVGIRQRGRSLYSLDEKIHDVTLYPGNVMSLSYTVTPVRLIYGRVRASNGEWLSNARIDGAQGLAVSDEFGMFQAEVKSNTGVIRFHKKGQVCTLPLSLEDTASDFINLGQVRCELNHEV